MPSQSVVQFWEKDRGLVVDEFSDEETRQLGEFITNTESNVFAWKLGDLFTPEQAGAVLSRYSRTALTGKRVFLKEFLPNRNRGREFFEAWLVDYGDDSIQEMAGGLPVSCEFISNVAAKEIEDVRFGSYIEKSSRYVSFDKKLPDGEYMFYKDPDIINSKFGSRYVELMRSLFDSYSKNTDAMARYLKEKNPFEEQVFRIGDISVRPGALNMQLEEKYNITASDLQKAYENAIKANALDFMRDYLPMATLTHVGISMNARSYENLILRLKSSPLAECKWIGDRMHSELNKIVPSLVKRIGEKHGVEMQKFRSDRMYNSTKAVEEIVGDWSGQNYAPVRLVDYTGMGAEDPNAIAQIRVCAAILYKFGKGMSLGQARETAASLKPAERDKITAAYVGDRANRRQKPGRAFENIEYTFDFHGRIGIYRDIHRHRVGTQERQNFTVKLGYNTRSEYEAIGILDDYKSKMRDVKDLATEMFEILPYQSQYVPTYGYNVGWYYHLTGREFYHLVELRTTPAGHPDYRKLIQDAFLEAKKVHPSIMQYMKFVDMSETSLGRLNAEIRIAQKKNIIAEKSTAQAQGTEEILSKDRQPSS